MSKRKTPDSPPDSRSALEHRCEEVDGMIKRRLASGDFGGVLDAIEVGCSVLDAQSFLRVETPCPCLSSEEDSPSDESDLGFLPVYTGPSRPKWSSSHSAFDVVYPGADDVEESDSEGGYVSGSSDATDSTVWVLES